MWRTELKTYIERGPERDSWRQSGVCHSGSRNSGVVFVDRLKRERQMLAQLESKRVRAAFTSQLIVKQRIAI